MSSLIENSPMQVPDLKAKVNQVKYLLDDASRRLQDEASKNGIFTTKSSASPISTASPAKQNGALRKQAAGLDDLKRTISDIGTIQPSIGPSDVNIDDNGELILAPPIESNVLSNYIDNQLDGQYLTDHSNSPQLLNPQDTSQNNGIGSDASMHQHQMSLVDENNSSEDYVKPNQPGHLQHDQVDLGFMKVKTMKKAPLNKQFEQDEPGTFNEQIQANNTQQHCASSAQGPSSAYDTEKLVNSTNSGKNNSNGHGELIERGMERTRVKSVAAAFESVINESAESRKLHRTNGNFALNRMVPISSREHENKHRIANNGQIIAEQHGSPALGYSNDLYHGAQDLHSSNFPSSQHRTQASEINAHNAYANGNIRKQLKQVGCELPSAQIDRPSRVSPSASAGSTVKLADECDSGTSSFRSQAAKGTLYSPQSHKPIGQLDEDTVDSSLDQEFIEKLSPEMERIKVTLEKGPEGIGIMIAGYTCEQEEISGIFIKGITPGGPADRCGKIRILDQIFAVNGQEILGYSNPEATNVLRRHTGKVVTLELMRYLAESRYQRLQNLLENALPVDNVKKTTKEHNEVESRDNHIDHSSAPMSQSNAASNIFTAACPQNANVEHLLNSQNLYVQTKEVKQPPQSESIYKNSSVLRNQESLNESLTSSISHQGDHSPMPIAAQRYTGATNKVIETKQGARNTIDIRSPMCPTTATATYVNKLVDSDAFDLRMPNNTSMVDRLRQEAPEEFTRGGEPEWERDVEIVELQRDSASQGLGFTVKEYNDPRDQRQSIIMITSIMPGGIAEMNGKLSPGDLLVFVDDKNLESASLNETVKALKETNGQVRLGVLKLKR